MKIQLDVATGILKPRQVPQLLVGEVFVAKETDEFAKKYGFIMDVPEGHPYAITHLNEGFTGIWDGFTHQWGPDTYFDRVTDEWVVSDLYTGRPLYLGKAGAVTVPTNWYTGGESLLEVLKRWNTFDTTVPVACPECRNLREYLAETESPEYAEDYFANNGAYRIWVDHWYHEESLSSVVPLHYEGTYQEVRANVNVVNNRAFAVPYYDNADYDKDEFDIYDLATGEPIGHYQRFGEVITRGVVDAVRISREDPLIHGLIPSYVPRKYLEYLKYIGKDYWELATRGIPARVV